MRDGLCNNCGTRLAGPYCHACGQKEVDDEWRSLGAISRQLWQEVVSVDFKSVRSLAGLMRPGHLSAEYIAGRRIRYLGPIKIYFLCAAVFFLIAPFISGFTFAGQLEHDVDGSFRTMAERRMTETHTTPTVFAQRYDASAKTVYTLSPILSVLAMTVLLRLLYRSAFDRLGPHAVVAVHYIAFFYLAAMATGTLNEVLDRGPYVRLLMMETLLAGYLFVALRRVYGEPAGRTALKTVIVVVLAFLIDSPINVAAKLLTVALT